MYRIDRYALRAARYRAGLLQRELGEAAGITQVYVSRLERSDSARITAPVLRGLCAALGCQPDDLIVDEQADDAEVAEA